MRNFKKFGFGAILSSVILDTYHERAITADSKNINIVSITETFL